MKNTTKKNIIQKIIISVLTILMLINFVTPTISRAADGDIGETVFSVIQRVVVGLGDGVMWIVNGAVAGSWKDAKSVYMVVKNPESAWEAGTNILGAHYVDYPVFKITPERIFANEIDLLNVNIINPPEDKETIVGKLQETVSNWYQALRNLVIVAMLSVLVYVAIRIILSSTAADKAKYKTMIKDWLIGFALIFFMHYIIAFSISAVELFTNAIKESNESGKYSEFAVSWTRKNLKDYGTADNGFGGDGYAGIPALIEGGLPLPTEGTSYQGKNEKTGGLIVKDGGSDHKLVFYDFMSYIRWNACPGDSAPDSVGERFAYSVLYLVFIFYTVSFLYKYLKRVVTTIFLVLISPFVAFSYSLDKVKDGSAQGFSTWLKEFLFNLLIQPMHLLLYYVLVGSAMDLAKESMIYVCVVLGFLLPAEKILREMFGFNKASSVNSAFGGAMVGAGVMGALGAVKRALPSGKPGGKGGNGGKGKEGEENPNRIRMTDRKPDDSSYDPADAIEDDDGSNRQQSQRTDEEVMEQYNNEGYGQNDEGNYFNPNTDEYDENYNPLEDDTYRNQQALNAEQEQEEARQEEARQGEQEQRTETQPREQETPEPEEAPQNPDDERITLGQHMREVGDRVAQSTPGRLVRGAGAGIGAIARRHNVTPGRVIKGVAKGVVKGGARLTLGGAGLMIGTAAGLASDDYSNIFKYGAAGALGGNAIGGKVGNLATSAPSKLGGIIEADRANWRDAGDEFTKVFSGKEAYQKRVNKRADDAWNKSKEVKRKYADAFIGEDYKKVMEDAQQYRKAGITDDDVIIAAMKANVPGANLGRADKKRIAAANLSQYVSNEKDVKDLGERLKKQGKSERGIEESQELIRQIKKTTYSRRGRR